jgi:hypothetical protein
MTPQLYFTRIVEFALYWQKTMERTEKETGQKTET